MRTFLLILLSATCVVAAPVPKSRLFNNDNKHIAGRWRQTFPQGSQSVWVFHQDGTALIEHGPKSIVPAKFVLRSDKKPKEFDWTLTEGNHQFIGIYELDDDYFRFSVLSLNSEKKRPSDIERNTGKDKSTRGECFEMERIAD